MRVIVAILGVVIATQIASADAIVVMAEPQAQLDSALRVVMVPRRVDVIGAPVPAGALRLERAAVAQRAAMQLGAHAAVWIDDAEVCAVTADGRDFRHAPFPAEAASPRAFAAIATSLLDEMISPEPWAQGFDVNVTVTPHGDRVAAVGPPMLDAPGLTTTVVTAAEPDVRAHSGRVLVEVGPMLSPLTAGLQGAASFSISHAWRFGGTAAINKTLDGDYTLGVFSTELRHVGRGRAKHWDIGFEGGWAGDGTDNVGFAGCRLARTWELSSTAVSLAFTPMLFKPLTGTDDGPFPAIYTSLRWQVPL
jgi:hypothetical protein